MRTQNYEEEKHWELRSWNYTRKHWEWGQGDSLESSHCFSLYYSWVLFFLVPRDETGWDWDHGSNEDGFHVTVRLHKRMGAFTPINIYHKVLNNNI